MNRSTYRWPTLALIALAALMIGWGVQNGGAAVVLRKAANICLECIGIG